MTPKELPRAVFLRTVNHILRDAEWARARLIPFADKEVALALNGRVLRFAVTPEGNFRAGDEAIPADATFTFSEDALIHAFSNPAPNRTLLFKDATINGNAEFTEALGFIFRNLEWDVEGELAILTGDIVARRLVECGKALAGHTVPRMARLLPHAKVACEKAHSTFRAAFLNHAGAWFVPAGDFSALVEETKRTSAEIARLEARISAMTAKH